MDTAFLIRLGIAITLLAVVFVLIARRQRRVHSATLGRPSLRRRVSTLPSGYRRIEGRLEPLGFRTLGDFDLCDDSGRRVHRMLISWHDGASTLSLRGMKVAGFFTTLSGTETHRPSIVVQTTMFDVDWTPPSFVVQTVRGVKHGSESAMLRIHDEAIASIGQEGWNERAAHVDPLEFALAVLIDLAAARDVGTKRSGIAVGRAAHRTYANGSAQVGRAIRDGDPAELPDRVDDANP